MFIDQAPIVGGEVPPQSTRVFADLIIAARVAAAAGQHSRRVVRRQRPGDGSGNRANRSRHRPGGGGGQYVPSTDTDPDKQVTGALALPGRRGAPGDRRGAARLRAVLRRGRLRRSRRNPAAYVQQNDCEGLSRGREPRPRCRIATEATLFLFGGDWPDTLAELPADLRFTANDVVGLSSTRPRTASRSRRARWAASPCPSTPSPPPSSDGAFLLNLRDEILEAPRSLHAGRARPRGRRARVERSRRRRP